MGYIKCISRDYFKRFVLFLRLGWGGGERGLHRGRGVSGVTGISLDEFRSVQR